MQGRCEDLLEDFGEKDFVLFCGEDFERSLRRKRNCCAAIVFNIHPIQEDFCRQDIDALRGSLYWGVVAELPDTLLQLGGMNIPVGYSRSAG